MVTASGPGLVQSLVIKGQRNQLDRIGREVSTPVIYLKAAWADPVLYGGRGERTGSDIDILVLPERFEAFASALVRQGFHRHVFRFAFDEEYFGSKEWSFSNPPGLMPVDLHRALADPVWFDLSVHALIDRAIAYDSVDGPILSLSAEDHVLYAAVHYANHAYELHDRHLKDTACLLEQRPVDWSLVLSRAQEAHMSLPLALFMRWLEIRGGRVPGEAVRRCVRSVRVRWQIASPWLTAAGQIKRREKRRPALDYLILFPLLSGRATALPRFLASYGVRWGIHALMRAAHTEPR